MNWGSLAEFVDMGGRGGFVWGAYGLSFFCLAVELWSLRKRRKDTITRLKRLQELDDAN